MRVFIFPGISKASGGVSCKDDYKVCFCENGSAYGSNNNENANGDCCDDDRDCESNNCIQTGPDANDKTCAPAGSSKSGKASN